MEFTVRNDNLSSELALLQRIVRRDAVVPVLSNVLVESDANEITLTASDTEMAMRTSCPASTSLLDVGSAAATLLLPAKRLYDATRLIGPEVDVRIRRQGIATSVEIDAATYHVKFQSLSPDDFPRFPARGDGVSIAMPAAELRSMIEHVAYAISEANTEYYLSGAELTLDGNQATLAATDSHRLAVSHGTCDRVDEQVKALIPRKALAELRSMLSGEVVTIAVAGNRLFFECGRRAFVTSRVSGQFPNWPRLVPKDGHARAVARRESLLLAAQRVSLVAAKEAHCMTVALSPGSIAFSLSGGTDVGDASDRVEAAYDGPEISATLWVDYVIDAVESCASGDVAIELKDGRNPAVVRQLAESPTPSFCLIMPMSK